MHIGLYWKSFDGERFMDIFSELDFEFDCSDKFLIHPVTAETGKTAFAFCLATIKGNNIVLDYRPFPVSNASEDIHVGRIQLHLERTRKISIIEANWCNEGSEDFEVIDFECKWPDYRPKTPKRIYDLVQNECSVENSGFTERLNFAFSVVPNKVEVNTTAFIRNPVVVKKALDRANGTCEICNQPAPFISKNTGKPYLEVHHIEPLSEEGNDVLSNDLAICPVIESNILVSYKSTITNEGIITYRVPWSKGLEGDDILAG